MEHFHIQTHYIGEIVLPDELMKQLPEKIALASTIQFSVQIAAIKQQLEDAGKSVYMFRSAHGREAGQILGCDVFELKKDLDCFLYVGDGLFHPTAILYQNKKPVFYYNPFEGTTEVLDDSTLARVNKKRYAYLAKFYASDHIGVLITSKEGQSNLNKCIELKKRLEADHKTCYLFTQETIDLDKLEDFPFIQCWVNSGCPRIVEDAIHRSVPMVNLFDLKDTTMKGVGVRVV